jgi:hypothetical protein
VTLTEGGTRGRGKSEDEGVRAAGLKRLDEARREYLQVLLKDARCWE